MRLNSVARQIFIVIADLKTVSNKCVINILLQSAVKFFPIDYKHAFGINYAHCVRQG